MKENKRKIIPDKLKENIDAILEQQLFNANRYYAENNPFIAKLVDLEAKKDSITFLKNLKSRWEWHNTYYEDLLEPALNQIMKYQFEELSPTYIDKLIDIYKTCCAVDESTLVVSAAIKKHLEYQLSFNNYYKNLSDDERFMLLTPPVESFYSKYLMDHVKYIIYKKQSSDKLLEYKRWLLNEYHCDDEKIFRGRMSKFSKFEESSVDELNEILERYTLDEEYKIKHFYFTIENDRRKAYRDIVIYDNVDEKLISYRLIGISGFLFRQYILQMLNDSQKLPNKGWIYEFNDATVIDSLLELKMDRKKSRDVNIIPYRQHGLTCAVCCMMMVFHYFGIISKMNNYYEKHYYYKLKSKYMDGVPFSAIAWYLSKNDFDVELIHSESEMFKNEGFMSDFIFSSSLNEYNDFLQLAVSRGTKVKNGVNIDSSFLKARVEEGKFIMLAGITSDILHCILLTGYKNDVFIVCDPLHNKKTILSKQQLEEYMTTPIGKWCICFNKKMKELESLEQQLNKYYNQAQNYLKLTKNSKKER